MYTENIWNTCTWTNVQRSTCTSSLATVHTYPIVSDLGREAGELLVHPHLSESLYPSVYPHNSRVNLSEGVIVGHVWHVWGLIGNLMHPILHTFVDGSVCLGERGIKNDMLLRSFASISLTPLLPLFQASLLLDLPSSSLFV